MRVLASTRLAALLWVAFLLLRLDGWGMLDGVPLRTVEASALAAIVWLAAFDRALPGGVWLPTLLLAFKIAAGSVLVPQGFVAAYYANATWTSPLERSPEYPASGFTRIDRRLQFDSPAGPHLPLYFFNDNTRFNYYGEDDPGRGELPFSVQWDGALWSPTASENTFTVRGRGLDATLFVDGRASVVKAPPEERATAVVALPAGWARLSVRIAAPQGRARSFEVTTDLGGTTRALGEQDVYVRAISSARLAWNRRVRLLSFGADALLLAFIAWRVTALLARIIRAVLADGVSRLVQPAAATAVLAIGMVAAFSDSLAFARLVDGRLLLLSGGNDMLTYETFARDIAINGPLMLMGRPVGQADAFYFQPFYPYFLAAAHGLFGEDAFGVFLLQRFGLWLALVLVGSSTRRLYGNVAAAGAVVAGALFMHLEVLHWSSVQLSEMLFIPLACLSLRCAIALAEGAGRPTAIATGLVGGFATLTRSPFAIAWTVAFALAFSARRRIGTRSGVLVLGACVFVGVIGLATIRNAVASHRFVLMASSGPVVLLLGNPPPPGTPTHVGQPHPVLRWLHLDDRTVRVAEGALHQPAAFAANLVRKALYTLGFFAAYVPGTGWSPILMVTWAAALLGLFGRREVFVDDLRLWTRWLPAALAASHFGAVTVFVPHVYGDRLILPFYVLLLPYVGAFIDLVWRVAVSGSIDRVDAPSDQDPNRLWQKTTTF